VAVLLIWATRFEAVLAADAGGSFIMASPTLMRRSRFRVRSAVAEIGYEGIGRLGEDGVRRVVLDEAAVAEDRDVRGQLHGLVDVVADEDDGLLSAAWIFMNSSWITSRLIGIDGARTARPSGAPGGSGGERRAPRRRAAAGRPTAPWDSA
jgi:hypothetical protein